MAAWRKMFGLQDGKKVSVIYGQEKCRENI